MNKLKNKTRRDFIKRASVIASGTAVTFNAAGIFLPKPVEAKGVRSDAGVIPSKGYLVVDSKKCTGCCTCMIACSMVHEGEVNLSLAGIQILANPFGNFPTDIKMSICQQCENPQCYDACPLQDQALRIDEKTGVRYINQDECTGCGKCANACAVLPSAISYNVKKGVSSKCDLCLNTPYWGSQGKQACVEACPVKAIQYTPSKPIGYNGYHVNLRGKGWAKLGLPTD